MPDIWDFIQHAQISGVSGKASDAKFSAEIANQRVQHLENRVEALALACQSMWELLAQKHGMTTQMLAEKMNEIDLRDGIKDGKVSLRTENCKSCDHKLSQRHAFCYYCGAALPVGEVFHRSAKS